MPKTTLWLRHRIIRLRELKRSVSSIARELGISRQTCYTWWNRYMEGGWEAHPKRGQYRKNPTTTPIMKSIIFQGRSRPMSSSF